MASSNLVLTGTSSVLARSNGEVVDLLAGGQGVFNIVPLAGVVDELEADIVRIDRTAQSRPQGERSTDARRCPGPPGSEPEGGGARRQRAPHPAGAPAGQVRFAHPSERLFAALLDLYEERWEYEPVEFALRWDEHGLAGVRLPPRLLAARPGSLHRADHGRPAPGHPQERQGAPDARALPRDSRSCVVYQRDFLALLAAHGLELPLPFAA